jgi:hypothetical protein
LVVVTLLALSSNALADAPPPGPVDYLNTGGGRIAVAGFFLALAVEVAGILLVRASLPLSRRSALAIGLAATVALVAIVTGSRMAYREIKEDLSSANEAKWRAWERLQRTPQSQIRESDPAGESPHDD